MRARTLAVPRLLLILTALALVGVGAPAPPAAAALPYQDPGRPAPDRVDDLPARTSLAGKSASTGPACQVSYLINGWEPGFTGNLTIRNTGPAALTSWALVFTFPSPGQRIVQGWSARWSQTGTTVTAASEPWNGNLAVGATVSIGFLGTHTGLNPLPTNITINGQPCVLG